jgi:hypothetical protein
VEWRLLKLRTEEALDVYPDPTAQPDIAGFARFFLAGEKGGNSIWQSRKSNLKSDREKGKGAKGGTPPTTAGERDIHRITNSSCCAEGETAHTLMDYGVTVTRLSK